MDQFIKLELLEEVTTKFLKWFLTSAPAILIILGLAILALKGSSFLLSRLELILKKQALTQLEAPGETAKRITTLTGIIRSAAKVLIWFIVILLLLREFGVDIAPILAGAGIFGLAIGFGAQNLVRDVISGFFLLMENQIRTGDVAVINGTGGLVESINLRTTVLRDLSGVVHIFPNGTIDKLSNMTKTWSAMVFDVGVAYKEDVDQVMKVMKKVADELQADSAFKSRIIEPIEILGVDKFEDSAVIIKARIKTKPIEQWNVGREYNRRLKKAFDENGIEIPFPHRTLFWGNDPKNLEGDKEELQGTPPRLQIKKKN